MLRLDKTINYLAALCVAPLLLSCNGSNGTASAERANVLPSLAGTSGPAPSALNLTTEGTADWAHWGLTAVADFHHKAAVNPQISNITPIGIAPQRFGGNPDSWTTHRWTDGTPDPATQAGSPAGIYFTGIGSGYQFTVPADNLQRTLRLYLGGFGSRSQIQANLSDGSAASYVTILEDTGVIDRVITLTFSAASNGQTLTISHTLLDQNSPGGNIALQAATLQSATSPPLPLADDFDDEHAIGWTTINQSNLPSAWSVINGEFTQSNRVESIQTFDQTYHLGTYAYLDAGMDLSNYRFSVDATCLSTDFAEDIGVMFRYANPGNYYRFTMNSRYGFSRLEKKVGGVFAPLAVNSRGYIIGQTARITIDVQGDQIQVLLDDDPLFSVADNSLTIGSVALYSQGKSKFDNVLVEAIGALSSVALSTPIGHSVQVSNQLNVSAIAAGIPPGGRVDFQLDGANLVTDTSATYATQYTGLTAGDHKVEAILRDASSVELARDTNILVGTGGEYLISIGDSITNGIGDNFSEDNISQNGRIIATKGPQATLTDLLEASLMKPVIVYNEGIGGDESADAVFTRVNSILARHPGSNQILVLLGTNDALSSIPSGSGCSGATCNGTFKGNMQALINTLTGAGKTVHVAKVPPVLGFTSPFSNPAAHSINIRVREFNNVIGDELSGHQIGPDLYDYFLGSVNRISLFSDGLHPNALGHTIVAYLWHNALNPGSVMPLPFVLNNLIPSTSSPYLKQNLLESGDAYYVDRAFTLTSIPPALSSGRWIMTANNDTGNSSSNYISFSVNRPVTVHIAYDRGASTLPDWMSTYTNTGLSLGTTDPLSPTLNLYSRSYGAGSIALGGNMASGASGANSHYIPIVVPD